MSAIRARWLYEMAIGLAFGFCIGPFATGCHSGKRDAAALVTAVDRFAQSPVDKTSEAARAVSEAPCLESDVCDAKQTCVLAIQPTLQSIAIKQEVKGLLDDVEAKRVAPEDPRAQSSLSKLDEAERLLHLGRDAMPGCEKKLAALRIKYRL